MCSTECRLGRLTAVPDDPGNIGRGKQAVERGDGRVETLSREVYGPLNRSALSQGVSAKLQIGGSCWAGSVGRRTRNDRRLPRGRCGGDRRAQCASHRHKGAPKAVQATRRRVWCSWAPDRLRATGFLPSCSWRTLMGRGRSYGKPLAKNSLSGGGGWELLTLARH